MLAPYLKLKAGFKAMEVVSNEMEVDTAAMSFYNSVMEVDTAAMTFYNSEMEVYITDGSLHHLI